MEWLKQLDELEGVYRKLPRIAGQIAVRFSKERFKTKDWVDNRTEPWGNRKDNFANPIMVGKQSGALRRSIRIVRVTPRYVIIGSDKPYARIHNEGGSIPVTEKMKKFFYWKYLNAKEANKKKDAEFWFNMYISKKKNIRIPRRQFMGNSTILSKKIEREALAMTKQAIK